MNKKIKFEKTHEESNEKMYKRDDKKKEKKKIGFHNYISDLCLSPLELIDCAHVLYIHRSTRFIENRRQKPSH